MITRSALIMYIFIYMIRAGLHGGRIRYNDSFEDAMEKHVAILAMGCYNVYDNASAHAGEADAMGRELRAYVLENLQRAMDYHFIQPYYQPVIRTIARQLCSFEALARWIDPELGTIYPDEFIPVLEEAGRIHLLDACIIRQVCARIRRSMDLAEPVVPVSVNLSRLDFELCDIFAVVNDLVTEYQIPHEFIYIEITESIMAEEKDLISGIVDRFRSAGFQVWMDDFGSAYSSLNVLKDYEFDEIKLDMRFLPPST